MAVTDAPRERILEEYLEHTEKRNFVAGAITVSVAGVFIVALAVMKYLWQDTELHLERLIPLDRVVVGRVLEIGYLVVDGAAKATIVLSVAFTLVLRRSVKNIIRQVIRLESDNEKLKEDTQRIAEKDPFHLDPQTGEWIKQWGEAGYNDEIEKLRADNHRLKAEMEQGSTRLTNAFSTLIEQIRTLKEELSRRE